MKKLIFIILLFPLLSAFAQDPKEFFPMQIGNYWEYVYKENPVSPPVKREILTIRKDTVMPNGKKYFIYSEPDNVNPIYNDYFRIDDSGNVYGYLRGLDCEGLYYKLGEQKNAYWKTYIRYWACDTLSHKYGIVYDIYKEESKIHKTIELNGDSTPYPLSMNYSFLTFVEGIGEYHTDCDQCTPKYLEKAIIRGVTVVDKGVIKVPEYKESKKLSYQLYQNYPNPFNPTTKIRYSIGIQSTAYVSVRLIIYDILGREIRVLSQGMKQPGEYETEWNGRNKYGNMVASGIYFYRLEVIPTNHDPPEILSNKMLLLR
jgi:hypothetical protein